MKILLLATLPLISFGQSLFINSGGPQSGIYQPDNSYIGGSTQASSDWAAKGIMRDLRYGPTFKYSIEVPNRQYFIIFRLFEPNNQVAGKRLFTITVNTYTSPPIDIFQRCGYRTACDYGIYVEVTTGVINIQFNATVGNAVVSAIEISPAAISFKQCVLTETQECNLKRGAIDSLPPSPNISEFFLLSVASNNSSIIANITLKFDDGEVSQLVTLADGILIPIRPGGIYTIWHFQGKYFVVSTTVNQ